MMSDSDAGVHRVHQPSLAGPHGLGLVAGASSASIVPSAQPVHEGLTTDMEKMRISKRKHPPAPTPRLSPCLSLSLLPPLALTRCPSSLSPSLLSPLLVEAEAAAAAAAALRKKDVSASGVRYSAERVIGNGSFGVVYQATVAETGETVAIKKVLQDPKFKNRELQIMSMLDHPNSIRLKHCFYR